MNRVILARYSEPLEWVKLIPDDFEVIIYNKGEKITSPEIIQRATRIVDRPNVGRESETYLNHMLNETDDNDDFTVYAQGDPFEHSPDFINLLHTWKHWQDLQAMSWQWREDKMIPPPAQRQMAARAGATTAEVAGSHAIYVSKPQAVADLIAKAANSVSAKATSN